MKSSGKGVKGHSCSKKVGIEFKVIAGGDLRDLLVQLPHCIGGDKGLPKVPQLRPDPSLVINPSES